MRKMSESENNLRLETVFKRSVQMLYPYTAPQPASASTRLLIFPDPGGGSHSGAGCV